MNIATLIGFISGLAVVILAISGAASDVSIFWNPLGLAVVLGGVFASTFICYPMKDVMHLFVACFKVFKREDFPVEHYIGQITLLSKQSLGKDILKLESLCQDIDNYFVKDGVRMIVDKYPHDRFRQIMETTIENTRVQDLAEAEIFRTMAKLSPAFGMVGTLIGMIVLFQNLAGAPSEIGSSISVAMMSTFYGLIAANLIFTPIAIKMERHAEQRQQLMQLLTEGLILISKRTPPEIIQDELKAFLPARKWQSLRYKVKTSKSKKPLRTKVPAV